MVKNVGASQTRRRRDSEYAHLGIMRVCGLDVGFAVALVAQEREERRRGVSDRWLKRENGFPG